jgi:hypothetical protein
MIFVGPAIAITVVAVTHIGPRSRRAGATRVPTTAVDADSVALRSTDPHSAGGVGPLEAFVAATITVLVATITLVIPPLGATRGALVVLGALSADPNPGPNALAHAALDGALTIMLVASAIAVVVDAVAGGVHPQRGPGHALVHLSTGDALGLPPRGTRAYATGGLHRPCVFVDQAIAIGVGPVTLGVIGGRVGRYTGVSHPVGGA